MLFQIYGENAGFQLLGWALVFVGLIAANELACLLYTSPSPRDA